MGIVCSMSQQGTFQRQALSVPTSENTLFYEAKLGLVELRLGHPCFSFRAPSMVLAFRRLETHSLQLNTLQYLPTMPHTRPMLALEALPKLTSLGNPPLTRNSYLKALPALLPPQLWNSPSSQPQSPCQSCPA